MTEVKGQQRRRHAMNHRIRFRNDDRDFCFRLCGSQYGVVSIEVDDHEKIRVTVGISIQTFVICNSYLIPVSPAPFPLSFPL